MIGALKAEVDGNTDQGAVYVFTFDGSTWTQQQKITTIGGNMGLSIALAGDTAVIGAGDGSTTGRVYVYHYNGSLWTQQQELTPDPVNVRDYFGISVSLSENMLLIGEPYDNRGRGAAYVFTYDGNTWVQQQKLINPDGDELDGFGISVALDGHRALIGVPYDDIQLNENQGSAYLYTYDGSWLQTEQLFAPDGEGQDRFGRTVAMDKNKVLIGVEQDDIVIGSAWIFSVP